MNPKTLDQAQKKIAIVVFAVVALAMSSMANTYNMTASDGFGAHSFDSAGSWSSGAAPTAGNNYLTGPYIVRTQTTGGPFTFAGDSLTIQPGGFVYDKVGALTITVNNCTNNGRGFCNAVGSTFTLLGNMYVPTNGIVNSTTNGGSMSTGSGNSSAGDQRTISCGMTVSGPGNLTNWSSDANWLLNPPAYPAAQGTVIYTADNSAFTGQQVALQNTVISVGSEANLGGNPPSFNRAQLQLNNGTFRPTASFALDHANSGIEIDPLGGWFDLASGITLTNAEPLAGSGTLTLTNLGALVQLSSALNASNFTGTLVANGGTFILGAANALAGSNTVLVGSVGTFDASAAGFTLASGQTLSGNGTVIGTVTAGTGSKISPGGAATLANLAVGNLTLSGGATLSYDFSGATNDVIVVNTNLSASGVTSIQLNNVPAVGTYTLMNVSGTLGGAPANLQVNALNTRSLGYVISYDSASTPKRVLLTVSSTGNAAYLIWKGNLSSVWDVDTTSNWLNGANSDVSYDADTNNFTDLGATNPTNQNPVTLNVTVNPGEVNFNSSSNYTLSGLGGISGLTALHKDGTGTLTMVTTNTYTGGTTISNGVLAIGYDSTGTNHVLQALGFPAGNTPLAVVSSTGTLELNGAALDSAYTNVVQINGNGSSATVGVIDNNGGGLTSGGGDVGIGTVALLGNSKVSASSNWQIGNTGSGLVGNGYILTKTGTNYVYLRHAAASPLGGLVLDGGPVLFWDHADAIGTSCSITLTNGAYIDTWNPASQYGGLTFYNPIVVATGGGSIVNTRTPYNHPPSDIYNGGVTLNSTLTFTNIAAVTANTYNNNQLSFGKITVNGNITGTGGIVALGGTAYQLYGSGPSAGPEVFGGNTVYLNGANSYSGPTLVTNLVWLYISTANQSGGAYDVVDDGTLDVAVAPGNPTIPMKSLTLETGPTIPGPGNIAFTRLSSMPASPVVYATNLTINNGIILPPTAGYSVGQFPLIKYSGSIAGAGYAGLQLGTVPVGVTASLSNNAVNHSIDLVVTAAGIKWTGANSTNWDTGTVNWYNPVTASTANYADGQSVVFPDNATNYYVSIAQTVSPGGVTVNSTNDYYWTNTYTTASGIAGSGALIKNGSGTLTLACTNNTFTGGTFINGGTIKLADQNYAYPYGGGALNNNLGNVTIANGGTLDINAVQVPNYQSYGPEGYNVFLSGAGVGGNGALVNNSTNQNDLADPGYVTLAGDATVGGIGDINIRMGVSPQMSSQSGAYTLTKVGTGQFRIRYLATVSTNFGPIKILGGNFTYESSSALGLGDPSKPIYVGTNGGFGWGTASAACVRPLICSNGASLLGLNITNDVFNSLVTLDSGSVNFNANYYHGMIFSNVISGAGGATIQYQSYVTFAAANTYSGPTTVIACNLGTGSLLSLVGNGSINNSLNITLQGITTNQALPGALDASGRTDGTLTLVSGQTLRGDNGSYVRGNVVANIGATITPGGGANIQYMSFSNNLTLSSGSTVAMDVSMDGGASNDVINVSGTNNYAGTLQLANSGVTPLAAGNSFHLFNNAHYTGNFATISGSPGAGLQWTFNPATGVATVTALPKPYISHIGVSGTTLTINATNGTANGQYILWQSTNVALSLSLWTPVLTNVYDSNGSLSLSTNIVNPAIPREFYILSQ